MRGGAVLIYSFHCVNLFNWFHFGQMWLSVKSLHSSGWGSLNVNTKDHHFVTPSWISVHSVHTIKFTIGGGTTCGLELVSRVQPVYRVCIVHEIVGVGGLFEWGGLARELRTLMEGPAPRHVGGLWKLDMKPLCAKYFHISLYCTSLDLSSSKIFW